MKKRKPPLLETLSDDTQKFFDVLNEESDLAKILVAASYLDATLEAILRKAFSDVTVADKLLNHPGGALCNYVPRIDVAYAIGLISSEMRADLLTIGKLRNTIAHSHLQLGFNNHEVAHLVGKLLYLKAHDEFGWDIHSKVSQPREKFVMTAVMISHRLVVDGLSVKQFAKRQFSAARVKNGVFLKDNE